LPKVSRRAASPKATVKRQHDFETRRMIDQPQEPLTEWHSYLESRPEYVRAIGMISIENANLEMALSDLLAAVLFLRRDVGRAIYFEPRAAILRVDILGAAARSRLRPKGKGDRFYEDEPAKAEALKQVESIVRRAKNVIGRRHNVIHDAWGIDDTTREVRRSPLALSLVGDGEPAPISDLQSLIRDTRKLIVDTINLSAVMRAKPPTLIDMQTEPVSEAKNG
jgi:hypothetical protein